MFIQHKNWVLHECMQLYEMYTNLFFLKLFLQRVFPLDCDVSERMHHKIVGSFYLHKVASNLLSEVALASSNSSFTLWS